MKTYRSARQVLADIEKLIASRNPAPKSPSVLVRVAKLLHDERNYYRVGIYLEADGRTMRGAVCGPELAPVAADQSASQLVIPIRIATQHLGTLRVEQNRQDALSGEDRVLLKEVAGLLALYLTSRGKYLVRKAREATRESAAGGEEPRPYQPTSDRTSVQAPENMRRAAAGDKSRS